MTSTQVQVAEEAAPAIHVPIIVGNQLYLMTQQDVRRVIDTRYISYKQLNVNGDFVPVNPANVNTTTQTITPINVPQQCNNLDDILEFLKWKQNQLNKKVENKPNFRIKEVKDEEMVDAGTSVSQITNAAHKYICAKCGRTLSKPCTITYSVGTSTATLSKRNVSSQCVEQQKEFKHKECQFKKSCKCMTTQTDSDEQFHTKKKDKKKRRFNYICLDTDEELLNA